MQQMEYCPKKSFQYLNFLFLQPDKRFKTLEKLRMILINVDEKTVDLVLQKVDMLFKYRITEHELAKKKVFLSLADSECMLSPKQCENILSDYMVLHSTLSQVTHLLTIDQAIELLNLTNLSNLQSHLLATALMRKITQRIQDLSISQLEIFVDGTCALCKNYNSIEGLTFENSKRVGLSETLLCDLLDAGCFNSLLVKLTKTLNTHPRVFDLMPTIKRLLQLIAKFLKVGGLSHSNKLYLFGRLSVRMYEEIAQLQEATFLEIVDIFYVSGMIMQMGSYNLLMMRVFREAQRAMIKIFKMQPDMCRMDILQTGLSTYTAIGKVDYDIFEQLYKPTLLNMFKNPDPFIIKANIPKMVSFASKVGLRDRTVIEVLISLLHDYTDKLLNIHPMIMRNLHLSLKFGFMQQTFLPEDKVRIRRLLNVLAAQCICTQQDLRLDPDFEPPTDGEVNCVACDKSRELVLSHHNSPILGGAQTFRDNHNERIIKSHLMSGLQKYIDHETQVTTEGQLLNICLYKWDGLIQITELGLKVGLEITGFGYRLTDDVFIKKKEVKLAMLREAGYLPLIIDVASPVYKNLILSFNMQLLEKAIAIDFFDQVTTFGMQVRFKSGLLEAVRQEVTQFLKETIKD